MIEYSYILLAIPIGLLVGMIPAIGATVTLILIYPMIMLWPFDVLIVFYAVMTMCVQFSQSVVALWVGLPGDVTAAPVIAERKEILRSGQLYIALQRTAIASAVSVTVSIVLLLIAVHVAGEFRHFMRTEVFLLITAAVVVVAIFWPANHVLINCALVLAGVVGSLVGYNMFLGKSLFTGGISDLVYGLPFIPVLLGLYAVPMLIAARTGFSNNEIATPVHALPKLSRIRHALLARGIGVGFVCGFIPLIGTSISSAVAYRVEQLTSSTALDRITASESANNAAAIAVLFPLIVFGVAIQPSEAIIANILVERNWTVRDVSLTTYLLLLVFAALGIITAYLVCVTFAKRAILFLVQYYNWVFASIVLVLISNIYLLGSSSNRPLFYLTIFALSAIIGLLLYKRNIDVLPAIFVWLVGPHLWPTLWRFLQLHIL